MFVELLHEWIDEKNKNWKFYGFPVGSIDILSDFAAWLDTRRLTPRAPERGQETIYDLYPGDWAIVGDSLYWICGCKGLYALNAVPDEDCNRCGYPQPDLPDSIIPAHVR